MKKYFLFLVLITGLFNFNLQAQNSAYLSIDNIQNFTKVVSTKDGGYAAIGRTNALYAGIICKLDGKFNVQWSKLIRGNSTNTPLAIVCTKDGNIAVQLGYQKNGKNAIGILKFSPSGTLIFSRQIHHLTGDLIASKTMVASTDDDGFLIAGGNCIAANFILKCSPTGTVSWSYDYPKVGATAVQSTTSLIQDGLNYTAASYSMTNTSPNDINMFNVDNSGNVQFGKTFATPDIQAPQQIIKLSNGQYVIAGYKQTSNQQNFYYFVNSSLSSVFTKQYTLANDDTHFAITESAPNNIIVTGSTYTTTSSANKSNFYFALDTLGAVKWSKLSDGNASKIYYDELWGATLQHGGNGILAVGTSYGDDANAAFITNNGDGFCNSTNVTLTTTIPHTITVSNATFNKTNLPLLTDTSNYIITDTVFASTLHCGQVNLPASINNSSLQASDIDVYPNPAYNNITIQVANNFNKQTVKVINAYGQIIYTNSLTNTLNINTQNWPRGLYNINIANNSKKIVLQ
jgi:hypothetical protein